MAVKYYPEDSDNNSIGILLPMNGRSDRASDGFFCYVKDNRRTGHK